MPLKISRLCSEYILIHIINIFYTQTLFIPVRGAQVNKKCTTIKMTPKKMWLCFKHHSPAGCHSTDKREKSDWKVCWKREREKKTSPWQRLFSLWVRIMSLHTLNWHRAAETRQLFSTWARQQEASITQLSLQRDAASLHSFMHVHHTLMWCVTFPSVTHWTHLLLWLRSFIL